MLNFKEKLIELRKGRGMTQSDLAEALHISRSAVANYEQGIREPNFEMKCKRKKQKNKGSHKAAAGTRKKHQKDAPALIKRSTCPARRRKERPKL